MRQIREMLRCHFDHGLSRETIARALGIAKGSVTNVFQRFQAAGLCWPLEPDVSDADLEARLYPPVARALTSVCPDAQAIEQELRRPHVTMELLWREYHAAHPDGMSRASFYRYYQAHRPVEPTMTMIHKAGDKLFVDYSGDGLAYVNRQTGEMIGQALFVCCLGASGFCYAESTPSQRADDFVQSHVRAFDYFGGVPAATVPDNLKSGVKRSDRYEPTIGPLYAKLAEHYGFVVLPARVRKPQDKALVENTVLNIQRYILGRLRDHTFFSPVEINTAIWALLEQFNDEPMKGYGGMSRRQRFLQIDQPALRALPRERFLLTAVQTDLRVARNYHVLYDKHHYSVPHALVGQLVDVYLVGGLVEFYHQGAHIARHKKQSANYGYSTTAEHMPPHHRFVQGWSPDYFLGKGSLIGPQTTEVFRQIFARYKHPEQAYKSCLGVLALATHYTPERLEAASTRALHYQSPTYRTLKAILQQSLDQQPLTGASDQQALALPFTHEHVRGPEYYQ
jgi:transposase